MQLPPWLRSSIYQCSGTCSTFLTRKFVFGNFACYFKHYWKCADLDECATNQHQCHANAQCDNSNGSYRHGAKTSCFRLWTFDVIPDYRCTCMQGYRGNGQKCENINECSERLANCPANSYCEDIDGSFKCECYRGYRKSDGKCVDINECEENSFCADTKQCVNTDGGFNCV